MLRQVTRFDSDILATIHAAAFGPAEAWSRDVFAAQLEIPTVFGFLHTAGALILLRVAADEADVLTLAVAPEVRRRGLAGRLLQEATTFAATLGVRSLFLEVSTANIAARTLYTKAGFLQAGLRPKYYLDLTDALVLRLDLGLPGPTGQSPGLLSPPN